MVNKGKFSISLMFCHSLFSNFTLKPHPTKKKINLKPTKKKSPLNHFISFFSILFPFYSIIQISPRLSLAAQSLKKKNLFEAKKTLQLYLLCNKEKRLTYFELKSQTFSTASYKGRILCHVMEPPLHHMREKISMHNSS